VELPNEESLRWIVSRYAALRAAHAEGIGEPALVQPSPEYFPDPFERSLDGVARFLTRMLHYAPVASDLDVRLRVVDDPGAAGGCGTGGCGSGACATGRQTPKDRVVDVGDGYVLELPASAAGHPMRLGATLARSVGTIVLLEAGEELEADEAATLGELAAVAVGLGPVLIGGAHIFGKSCGGVHVEECTELSLEEIAVALALFVRLGGHKPSRAKSQMEVTQREAFDLALEWVDANPDIVRHLGDRPELLEPGVFPIHAPHGPIEGIFRRLFSGSKKNERPENGAPPSTKAPKVRSEEETRRLERARALVDAALGEPGERSSS
jgi:hypothetical protein